jgi:hypothetical protein
LSIQEAKSWTEKMGDQEKTGDQVKIVRRSGKDRRKS